jgi:hypothetical protein
VGAVASTPWIGDWAAREESDGAASYEGPPLRWFNEPAGTTHGGATQTYPSIGDWAAETMASYGGPPLRWFNDNTATSASTSESVAAPASSEWIADWAAESMAGYISGPPSDLLLEPPPPPPSQPLEGALHVPGRVHQVRERARVFQREATFGNRHTHTLPLSPYCRCACKWGRQWWMRACRDAHTALQRATHQRALPRQGASLTRVVQCLPDA